MIKGKSSYCLSLYQRETTKIKVRVATLVGDPLVIYIYILDMYILLFIIPHKLI